MRPDSLVPATLSAPDVAPIRVLELELASDSEPRTPLPGATAGGKTALVLVRIHGEPVGTVHVGVPTNGLTRSQCIPAIARELGQPILEHLHRDGANSRAASDLCAAARMAQPACSAPRTAVLANPPSVSVVVATHDRPESVRNCIGSLARQTYPRFEVLVVVNAPPPAVDFRHVQRAFAGDARIRWLHEPLPGACRARNLGIEEARGQIIAFCDDDVIHDPDWLLELACAFQEAPGVGCATGLVCPAELDTDAQIWFEQYGGLGTGFTPRLFDMGANRPADPFYPFRPATFGVGTNMAYRAEVVRELGGFDPSLGPGTPACSGEDYALYYATLLDGYQIAYRPSALVYHRHRRDYASLRQQIHGYAVGYAAAISHSVLANPLAGASIARGLPRGVVRLVRSKRSYAGRPGFPAELSRVEMQGLLFGPALLMLSKARASLLSRRAHSRKQEGAGVLHAFDDSTGKEREQRT